MSDLDYIKYKAYQLRVHSLISTTEAGSGHPTSCLSAADIVAALFFNSRFDHTRDYFILSKGHAAPLLYAAYRELGYLSNQDLNTLRKFDSILEGHPTPRFPFTDTPTGSLGMGLAVGVGKAYADKNLITHKHAPKTFVLMGDGELSEGSVWEAANLASFYKLNNLIALVDINRLGQSGESIFDWDIKAYVSRFKAFGFEVKTVNGHNIKSLVRVIDSIYTNKNNTKPIVILAKTIKGFGLKSVENQLNFHGKVFSKNELPEKLRELKLRFSKTLKNSTNLKDLTHKKLPTPKIYSSPNCLYSKSPYTVNEHVSTRKAFGQALLTYGRNTESIVVLDGDVQNSTYTEFFAKKYPNRFIECFIAEQSMIGLATGIATQNFTPVAATFGAFFSRAYDQLRMAGIGQIPLRLCGSHAGVSIGQDGPSQMALEDFALMRALPNSVVLSPCDATSTHYLVREIINHSTSISYMRTLRSDTPVIYDQEVNFKIGGSSVLKQTKNDRACIVATGITVFEALKAQELLAQKNIFVSVVDAYSIKPLDSQTIIKTAQESHNFIITVEDHYAQGGLGEAVCHACTGHNFVIKVLAVTHIPRSGSPEELRSYEKIDAQAIIDTVISKA